MILHYLRLSFWPDPLVFDYGWPVAHTAAEILPGAVVVGGLLAATAYALARWPMWGTLGAWFFLILAPTSSIMPIADLAFEHRMYLPLAAVVAATVIAGYALLERLHAALRIPKWGANIVRVGLVLALVAALGVTSYARNRVYQSEWSLWNDVVHKAPDNPRGYYGLAYALERQGNAEEAIARYQQALAIRPGYAEVHNNLAKVFFDQGKLGESTAHCLAALETRPQYAEAHNNLASILLQQGKIDEALAHSRQALEIAPHYAEAHNNLANVLYQQGKIDEAIAHYRQALQTDPPRATPFNNLGVVLFRQGRVDEAMAHFRKAIDIDPRLPQPHYWLGCVLQQQGKSEEALGQYQKTLAIDPRFAEARCNLAVVLISQGKLDEAIVHCQQALRISPSFAEARYHLGRAYYLQGKGRDAISQWRETLRLQPNEIPLLNILAWELATCPQASVRNGPEAVELAQRAVQLSRGQLPDILDTLGAALAEAGRFPDAVETAQRAMALASSRGDTALADALRSRIRLYQAKSPFLDTRSPLAGRNGSGPDKDSKPRRGG